MSLELLGVLLDNLWVQLWSHLLINKIVG
jgi:hypothetical protein